MENEKLLLRKNKETIKNFKVTVIKNHAVIQFRKKKIGGKEIFELIKIINFFERKYKNIKIPITIDLGDVCFADKLSMIIFENICHYITNNLRIVNLSFEVKEWDIWNEGIWSSPLLLLTKHDSSHQKKFVEKYRGDLFRNHYRKIVLIDEKNNHY